MKNKKRLFSSLHMIVMCAVLLLGVTWAWFSERIEVPGGTIKAAEYGAKVYVSSGDQGFVEQDGTSFIAENGKVYDIKITATGTVDEMDGYSVISAGDMIWHTAPLNPKNEIVITAKFPGTGSTEVFVLPSWGTYREELNAGVEVTSGDIVITGGDAPAVTVTEDPAEEEGAAGKEPGEVTGNN